jgi:hypothetical protein
LKSSVNKWAVHYEQAGSVQQYLLTKKDQRICVALPSYRRSAWLTTTLSAASALALSDDNQLSKLAYALVSRISSGEKQPLAGIFLDFRPVGILNKIVQGHAAMLPEQFDKYTE